MDSDESRLLLVRKAQQKVAEVVRERDLARELHPVGHAQRLSSGCPTGLYADALVIIKALLLALPEDDMNQAILELPEWLLDQLEV